MVTDILIDHQFERIKNQKALAYTLGICGALLLLFFLVPLFHPPTIATAPVEDYVEINLGSGDQGFGSDQPQIPGDPAPAASTSYTPPQPVASNEEASKDVEDIEHSPDAAPVIKPSVTRPEATKINTETRTRPTTNTNPQPVTQERKPAVVMGQIRGGSGTGGNGASTYERGGSEGIAGGTGDQGRVGGDPNGRNYTGQPRNMSGIKIINMPAVTYQDDFKESGKVMMDVLVNSDGKLVSATYQPRGSTISNQNQINIARRWLSQTNWPKVEGGFRQTVQVTMTVNN